MKNIYIHLGHEKTGSSFIQSSLEKSVSNLEEFGIYYPIHKSKKTSPDAQIRSGNTGKRNLIDMCQKFVKSNNFPSKTLLLSNETLFKYFANDENYFHSLRKIDANIKIVLMIRNPLELAFSSYGQNVKRGGYIKDFEDFLIEFDIFDQIFRFFEFAKKHSISINFVNYSEVKNSLLDIFSEMIDVPPGTLKIPDVKVINRSLSDVETYIQKKFNGKYGREARKFISDPLCVKLTDIKSGAHFISEKNFHNFKQQINKKIIKFNLQYAESSAQKYRLISDNNYTKITNRETTEKNFSINSDQLDVLIESLHRELVNPFTSIKRYIKWKFRPES